MTESSALAGKAAVVTGAGREFGRAIAVAYAAAGAAICCAVRTQSEIDETVELCRAEGGSAIAIQNTRGGGKIITMGSGMGHRRSSWRPSRMSVHLPRALV